jgi:hypothetical protein
MNGPMTRFWQDVGENLLLPNCRKLQPSAPV